MDLSVVIPAYNEGHRLPVTLDEIRPYLDSVTARTYEVLVVDDGSSDHTVKLCLEKGKNWPQLKCIYGHGHHGKGASVKRGCLQAEGDYVLVMDADHPTPIDTFDFLLPHFKEYEMVVGVRTFCGEEGSSGRFRRIIGLAQQLFAHIVVFQKSVADSQCGFKAYSRRVARLLFGKSLIPGGMFDCEIFYLAHKYNVRIFSQPVKWVNKEGSTINMTRCVLLDPFSLFKIRLNDLLRRYN